VLPQDGRRLEQPFQQRLQHVPRADHPRSHAIDARVEVVETDVGAAEKAPAHELLADRLQVVVEDDDVIAVPSHAAAHVQENLGQIHEDRAQFVRNRFGRMVVSRVERIEDLAGQRVPEVELVRTDRVALVADAEQLSFDRVQVVRAVERILEDRVERLDEPFAGPDAIDRRVLHAVRNPEVRHARRPQRLSDGRAYPTGGTPVADPELARLAIGVREREARGTRVREERRIEIQTDAESPRPFDPAAEMLGANLVAPDRSPAEVPV
jgi:hypothetical protein